MKKNLYYRSVHKRENIIRQLILSTFGYISSYARLLLEVFIRHNFGERYFRLSSAITVAVIVGALPIILMRFAAKLAAVGNKEEVFDIQSLDTYSQPPMVESSGSLWTHYILWYVFLVAFIILSLKHHRDQQRKPGVFYFKRFSLSDGTLNPFMYRLPFFKKSKNYRLTECLLEPAVFFIAGCAFLLIGQYLGWLLVICSMAYSTSYIAAWDSGDNFIMDKIDEIICNEELENSFINGATEEETRGFRFRGRRPDSKEYLQKIMPLMMENEETLVAE
ncbi:hypothetical protein [Flavobacterium sp.]|uniref:hypothetical protein n=1 Tax=Flavobacterium sp. TaxID=239 RepID=UPI0039E5449B